MVVEAYGTLGADGLLADPVVASIATERRRSPAQVLLRHALQRGQVALVKSTSPQRIAENATPPRRPTCAAHYPYYPCDAHCTHCTSYSLDV